MKVCHPVLEFIPLLGKKVCNEKIFCIKCLILRQKSFWKVNEEICIWKINPVISSLSAFFQLFSFTILQIMTFHINLFCRISLVYIVILCNSFVNLFYIRNPYPIHFICSQNDYSGSFEYISSIRNITKYLYQIVLLCQVFVGFLFFFILTYYLY